MSPAQGTQPTQRDTVAGFEVHLANFEGPFDLLLTLISRRELDVTEVALSQVTDEFISHVLSATPLWDLDTTSAFVVVSATLLDMKTAGLLPGVEASDTEDIAALEARDLLFARLLQYRAFKRLAEWIAERLDDGSTTHWRPGGLEEHFVGLLPEVDLSLSAVEFADLAVRAMTPRRRPVVELTHLHAATVSLSDELSQLAELLRARGAASFRALVADADRLTAVVRFLAVLELFRAGQVSLEQLTPLGELTIRWSAGDADVVDVVDDYGGGAR